MAKKKVYLIRNRTTHRIEYVLSYGIKGPITKEKLHESVIFDLHLLFT